MVRADHGFLIRRALLVLLGTLAAAGVAAVLAENRYQLERSRQSLQLRESLQSMFNALNDELQQGTLALSDGPAPAGPWHAFRWEAGATPSGQLGPLEASAVRQMLRPSSSASDAPRAHAGNAPLWRMDLLPNAQGRDVVVLARGEGPAAHIVWHGVWGDISELLNRAGVVAFARQGYRLQLYDASQSAAWYQSEPGRWEATTSVALQVAGQRLELRAASRDTAGAAMATFTPSLLLVLAVVFWLSMQVRQGRALHDVRGVLAQTEQRRRETNERYGQALQSLADLESQLRRVSLYDGATGLANRSSLIHRLETLLASMRAGLVQRLYIIAIGFDSLPHITGSLGTDFAARVLAVAAERIAGTLPSRDALFITSDQQLAVLMAQDGQKADEPEPEGLAQRLAQSVESPIALDGHTIMLHPSVGIAPAGSAYESAEALLDQASMAVAAVPHESESRLCRYSSEVARLSAERLQLEADLDRAFEQGQFELEYEPFVQPLSQTVVGFEALIRWNHPTEGRVMPGRFVPLALQAGMAHRLNSWVMREAARQAAALRRAGLGSLFITFNLTAEAFLRPTLVAEMTTLLSELELPGEQLVIELTESTLVQDAHAAARVLHELAELGVAAWLDDFGTGYSSLSHLRSLPLRGVKIDRAFIEHVDIDSRDFGFLKALIDLISYLGLQSIAEGIETLEKYELLTMTSCDLYQGYYFARSMPGEQIGRWLQARADSGAPNRAMGGSESALRRQGTG